ncbi:MAG TPA: CHASE2 domain-containing protein, partial [Longimicrobiales bacterium]|nr:CHASE2 domain-containing protein [Longimicrobiales bacterium]
MKYRRHLIAAGIAAASAVAAYTLVTYPLFDPLFGEAERTTVDYRLQSVRVVQRDSSDVLLVLFGENAVATWPFLAPFPRGHLADLILTASANGAAVIGLDVLLDRRYPELGAIDPDGDERLRDAIAQAGNVVLVSATEPVGDRIELVRPDPYFAEVAAAVGTADMVTPYELTRDARLVADTDEGPVPGFALALYAVWRGLDADSLARSLAGGSTAGLPGLPSGYVRGAKGGIVDVPIVFQGPPSQPDREQGTFRAYGSEVIAMLGVGTDFQPSEAMQSWMGGRAVLLGSGWHDNERFRTPFYDFVF